MAPKPVRVSTPKYFEPYRELTRAEKLAKEKLENPTVDENGEHIQTVAEAKLEAQAMQNMLDEGIANVDRNIQIRNQMIA
jgi:hypothetical protein